MNTSTDRIEQQILLHAPLERVWHALADPGDEFGIVRIARHVAIAVVDLDDVAVAAAHSSPGDDTVGDGGHGAAHRGVEIDARMKGGVAVERIRAAPEARRDIAVRDRHAGRQQGVVDLAVAQQVLEDVQLRRLATELGRIDIEP